MTEFKDMITVHVNVDITATSQVYALNPETGQMERLVEFPLPGVGPFSLLEETQMNHWGKMMFRWVYWNLMMKGHDLPLEPQMNLAGKTRRTA